MRKFSVVLLTLGLLLAACSDDDSAEQTTATSSTTSTTEADGTTTVPDGDEPSPEPDDPTGTGLVCEPTGEPVAVADSVLDVSTREWEMVIPNTEIGAGAVFLNFTNTGDNPHELRIVAAESIDSLPTHDDGSVDDDAVEGFEKLGPIGPGDSCEGTYQLEPGTYVIYSNLVDEDNGSYFELGVAALITVV